MTNARLNTMANERLNSPTSAGVRVEIAEAVLQDYLALHAPCRDDLAKIETARPKTLMVAACAVTLGAALATYSWLT